MSNPTTSIEFSLAKVDGQVVARVYSPDAALKSSRPERRVLSRQWGGHAVVFTSTTEDYLDLFQRCKPSNRLVVRETTAAIIEELRLQMMPAEEDTRKEDDEEEIRSALGSCSVAYLRRLAKAKGITPLPKRKTALIEALLQ